jgi:hypothetical protein
MNDFNIEECSRCFVARISDSDRKSKCVSLLSQQWNGCIIDPIWVGGALSTTALRKRPQSISMPKGDLGYTKAKDEAKEAASQFLLKLRQNNEVDYTNALIEACDELEKQVSNQGIHWTFGRSQKFFNILTKYWYCVAKGFSQRISKDDLKLVQKFSPHFNAPVDSITLRHVKKHSDYPKLNDVYWGWNMNKSMYLKIQEWIREQAAKMNLSPLEYELIKIW